MLSRVNSVSPVVHHHTAGVTFGAHHVILVASENPQTCHDYQNALVQVFPNRVSPRYPRDTFEIATANNLNAAKTMFREKRPILSIIDGLSEPDAANPTPPDNDDHYPFLRYVREYPDPTLQARPLLFLTPNPQACQVFHPDGQGNAICFRQKPIAEDEFRAWAQQLAGPFVYQACPA